MRARQVSFWGIDSRAPDNLSRARIEKTGSAAYIPVGFDNNDVPEIYVKGKLKDTCHLVGPHEVTVDQARKRVTIRQSALVYTGMPCWPISISFDHEIKLPILETIGDYEIVDGASTKLLGTLNIEEAKAGGTDNYIYAPVRDFNVVWGLSIGHHLTLSGELPNDCLRVKEVRVDFQPEVVVVLPIVEAIPPPPGGVCRSGRFAFFEQKPLRRLFGQHPYLFHVRAMGGKALNKLVEPYRRPYQPRYPLILDAARNRVQTARFNRGGPCSFGGNFTLCRTCVGETWDGIDATKLSITARLDMDIVSKRCL